MGITDIIISNENTIRLSFFIGILVFMGLWEVLAPRRRLKISKLLRWVNNLGLVMLNSLLLRLIFPAAAVGMATFASDHSWGLLNYYELAPIISIMIAIIVMDLIIYLQHVLVHAVPLLWRFHRVHHTDLDYDVTTGSRFHPVEIIFSMLIKFSVIIVIGAPVIAVILFEIILNGMAMFNHANVGLPKKIDFVLRWFVVTPDMHRVHHSIEEDETNSNFGFNLSLWDRIFGTYRAQPRAGHEGMSIGINGFCESKQVVWLTGLLSLPFIKILDGYTINRRDG